MKKLLYILLFIPGLIFSQDTIRDYTIYFSETFENYGIGAFKEDSVSGKWNPDVLSWKRDDDSRIVDSGGVGGKRWHYGIDEGYSAGNDLYNGSHEMRIDLGGNYQEVYFSADVRFDTIFDFDAGGKCAFGAASDLAMCWRNDQNECNTENGWTGGGLDLRDSVDCGWVAHTVFSGSNLNSYGYYWNPSGPWSYCWNNSFQVNITESEMKAGMVNMTIRYVLNDTSVDNGIIEYFKNGELIWGMDSARFITASHPEASIQNMWKSFFYGGSNVSPQACWEESDNYVAYVFNENDTNYVSGASPSGRTIPIMRPEFDFYGYVDGDTTVLETVGSSPSPDPGYCDTIINCTDSIVSDTTYGTGAEIKLSFENSYIDSISDEVFTNGGSLSFDSVDYKEGSRSLSVGTDGRVMTDTFTFDTIGVSMWLLYNHDETQAYLWSYDNQNGSYNNGLAVYYRGTNGSISFQYGTGSSNDRIYTDDNPALTEGSWNHVYIEYTDTIGKIYVDGVRESTNDTFIYDQGAQERSLYIGNALGSWAGARGNIDNVQVFTRALTEAEIDSLADNPDYNIPGGMEITNDTITTCDTTFVPCYKEKKSMIGGREVNTYINGIKRNTIFYRKPE
jgi:hypothetical protein